MKNVLRVLVVMGAAVVVGTVMWLGLRKPH